MVFSAGFLSIHMTEQLKKGRASEFCQGNCTTSLGGIRMDTAMISFLTFLSFLVRFALSFLHYHIPSTLLFKVKVKWSFLESHRRLAKAKYCFLINTWIFFFTLNYSWTYLAKWLQFYFIPTWKQKLFSTRSHVLPSRGIGPVLCL